MNSCFLCVIITFFIPFKNGRCENRKKKKLSVGEKGNVVDCML